MDIAPIFTLISAFTTSSLTFSTTLPPSTHGITRDRSVIAAKFSSAEWGIVNEWSSSTPMCLSFGACTAESKDRLPSAAVFKYRLGPDDGTLAVHTKRGGAAKMAGHDLLMHVTRWEATIELGGAKGTALELEADGSSLKVIEGSGGMQ